MTNSKAARPGTLESAYDAAIVWRYMAPAGHTLEDCLEKDYWRNALREVGMQRIHGKPAWNRIEIIAEDGTWEAELRVVSVSGETVQTRTIRAWREQLAKAPAPEPEGYTVEYISGNGWRALDRNASAITEKRASRDEALLAAVEHNRRAKGGR